MSAECPPNLFKEFEAGCGSFVKPDKDGLIYIYEILFSHFEHAEAIEFTYPRLPEATFTDWEKFSYWCDGIQSEFISLSPHTAMMIQNFLPNFLLQRIISRLKRI